jgi:hypothetical protein
MSDAPPPIGRSLIRIALRLLIIVAIAYGAHLLIDWVMVQVETLSPSTQKLMLVSIIGVLLFAYSVLMATPFVPGIEIGLALIVLRGPDIVPYVYLATFCGLATAYLIGRFMPREWLRRALLDFRLMRASELLDRADALPPHDRLKMMCEALPKWMGPTIARWRYLVLAALINVPGNALIGGGGGICLVAGLSGVFRPLATLVTLAIAVSPFPLFVWFFGTGLLTG